MRGMCGAYIGVGLLALLGASATAQAQTRPSVNPVAKTIFGCKSVSGKILRFAAVGREMRYSYGKAGAAPDLAFAVPLASVSYGGSGPADAGTWWVSREIKLSFNGTSYTGHWAYNRGDDSETAGVTVTRAGRVLAETACASDIEMQIPEPAED